MREPKTLFRRGSWRIREGGGLDRAGKFRGCDVERLSSGEWKFRYHRVSLAEATKIITDYTVLGRKPPR